MVAPRYPIASVDTALRLLLSLRQSQEIKVSEAASSLGVAKSTTHRLLAMLRHHELVEQDPVTHAYRVGPSLVALARATLRRRDVQVVAAPAMRSAAADLDETIHLGVLDGAEVRYLDAIESTRAVRVAGRSGRRLPAHCTAIGKALLAYMDDQAIRTLLGSGPLPQETSESLSTIEDVLAEVARVRSRGYAVNRGESEEGVIAVAVAIIDDYGHPIAAISCAIPAFRADPEVLAAITDALPRHAQLAGQVDAPEPMIPAVETTDTAERYEVVRP